MRRNRHFEHAVLSTLHEEHRSLAEEMARDDEVKTRVLETLRTDRPDQLHLVHSCSHFPNVYALNRFLVLLIDQCLDGETLILSGRRTQNVVSIEAQHTCNPNLHQQGYLNCHGKPHRVELVEAAHCAERNPNATPVQLLEGNIIIIRHGGRQDPGSPIPEITLPRQLPPHHVYWSQVSEQIEGQL